MHNEIFLPALVEKLDTKGNDAISMIAQFNELPYIKEFENQTASLSASTITVADIKPTLANLRKLKDEINSKRIAIGKEWNKPIADFKVKVDRILSTIDIKIDEIARVQAALDEEEKQAKQMAIDVMLSADGFQSGIIPPGKKWLNKTEDLKKIEEEIKAQAAIVEQAKSLVLDQANNDVIYVALNECLEANKWDSNLLGCLLQVKRAKDQQLVKMQEAKVLPSAKAEPQPMVEPEPIPVSPTEEILTVSMTVKASRSIIVELKKWLKANNVEVL